MQLQQRINAFVHLGKYLGEMAQAEEGPLFELLDSARIHNGWFSMENLRFALRSWSDELTEPNISAWLEAYNISEETPKTIAIIMAGNVPLVGFHDFLSVLLSGHKALVKLSSNDKILMPKIYQELLKLEPGFSGFVQFTEEKLESFDAVIATGSNNSARYFEYYFGKYPHIIRKNRNSVALLTGNESEEELRGLADDIFRYFGMGCRNVSKLFVPKGYNFDAFFKAMYTWKDVINETKYMNNYDYNKAVYLMSNIELLDNEFMLLKEDKGFSSPISVVFYEYYDGNSSLEALLSNNESNIQCIVANDIQIGTVNYGETQTPALSDYADGVDTVRFLSEL